ncbi:YciI family protein, partial [Sphingopyxis flava]
PQVPLAAENPCLALGYRRSSPQTTRHLGNAGYMSGGELPVRVILSGPLMDEAEEKEVGSLIVVEATNRHDVEEFSRNDPYRKAGLVGAILILPWRWTRGNPDRRN